MSIGNHDILLSVNEGDHMLLYKKLFLDAMQILSTTSVDESFKDDRICKVGR